VLLVLVVLAAVIAVSTSSGGLRGSSRSGSAKPADLFWRVMVGGGIGALIGVAVLALLHRLAPSRPSLARSLYGETWQAAVGFQRGTKVTAAPSWRLALRRGIPLVLLLAAVGALIGASTAPLHAKTSLPPPSTSADEAEDGRPTEEANGRYVDTDGDGKPELQIDADGDGRYESTYVPCPGSRLPSETPRPDVTLAPGQKPGTIRVPIDEGCDGTIDRYVDVRLDRTGRITTVPTTTSKNGKSAPVTTVPRSQANKVSIPSWIGQLLLVLLAIGVVAAVVIGIMKRNKKPDEVEKSGEEDDAPDTAATAVAVSVERSRTELVVEDDPRRAIITAYQTLLDGLGAVGLPRRPQEAPEEYLRRSLAGVSVDLRPFHELTRLFGLARFSRHAITEAHRTAAQQALADAAASLPNLPQTSVTR
jgi:Domain of unknown function (DUF4129)